MKITAQQSGFTIIEMVIVIVVGGIIASIIAQFITRPMEGYVAQGRRSELVDIAETALNHITRDVRQALPNSVRIACGGQCLEILHTLDGGRYRLKPPGNQLKFTGSDTLFDSLGPLNSRALIINNIASTGNSCFNTSPHRWCVSIFNTGNATANSYNRDNMVTLTSLVTASDGISDLIGFDNTEFSTGNTFPYESPNQRFYVVDTPISFICSGGEINRYHDYAITAAQPVASPGGKAGLLANNVTACNFSYQSNTATRSGLLTASITVSDSGESITLLQQAHIVNQP